MTTRALLGGLLATALAPAAASGFALHSTAFAAGAPIPTRYSCEGADVSPPLAWAAPPPGTRSFALIVDDPDAPDPAAPRATAWVHWVLYDLPASATGLAEGVAPGALPPGTRQGRSDGSRSGYHGPCPPIGRHRYVFHLYALDTVLSDLGAARSAELARAMQGHVLAQTTLTGTYEKTGVAPGR